MFFLRHPTISSIYVHVKMSRMMRCNTDMALYFIGSVTWVQYDCVTVGREINNTVQIAFTRIPLSVELLEY
jgi:hypothetical protein